MATTCDLKFFTAQRLDSKGEHLRERAGAGVGPGRSYITFYDVSLKVMHNHFYCILLVKAVTKTSLLLSRGQRDCTS